MGGESEQLEGSGVRTQLEILPIRVHRRLHNGSLPVSEADDLPLEQTQTARKAVVLQHEMTLKWTNFAVIVWILYNVSKSSFALIYCSPSDILSSSFHLRMEKNEWKQQVYLIEFILRNDCCQKCHVFFQLVLLNRPCVDPTWRRLLIVWCRSWEFLVLNYQKININELISYFYINLSC